MLTTNGLLHASLQCDHAVLKCTDVMTLGAASYLCPGTAAVACRGAVGWEPRRGSAGSTAASALA